MQPADDPTLPDGEDDTIDEATEASLDNETLEPDDPEAPDEFAGEAGLDLSDASELDADNVPADEESDRVMQAPD